MRCWLHCTAAAASALPPLRCQQCRRCRHRCAGRRRRPPLLLPAVLLGLMHVCSWLLFLVITALGMAHGLPDTAGYRRFSCCRCRTCRRSQAGRGRLSVSFCAQPTCCPLPWTRDGLRLSWVPRRSRYRITGHHENQSLNRAPSGGVGPAAEAAGQKA